MVSVTRVMIYTAAALLVIGLAWLLIKIQSIIIILIIALTLAAVLAIGLLLGLDWHLALVAGMGVAMSSTAIAVQTLAERGLGAGEAGAKADQPPRGGLRDLDPGSLDN